MKDSTVGANAAISLVSLLLFKIGLYLVLLPDYFWLLLLFPLISRWILLDLAVHYPYAGKEGSLGGTVIGQAGRKELCCGSLVALLLTILIGGFAHKIGLQEIDFVIYIVLVAWLTGIITGRLVARVATKKISGVTGDVLGAAVELVEVAVLLAIVVFSGLFV